MPFHDFTRGWSRTLKGAALALCLAIPAAFPAAPAMAERRVYTNEEAEALKCVYLLSFTAAFMERGGYLSTRDKEMMFALSAFMLEKYVSGTQRQKLLGVEAVGKRRNTQETLKQFKEQSRYCIRRFPVGN